MSASPARSERDPVDTSDDARPLVLFDGVCNLCNATVNFLLDRDPEGALRFGSLQSNAAGERLRALGHPLPAGTPESLLFVEGGRVYRGSTAALRIARYLSPRGWRLVGALLLVVPRPLRDAVYGWIARNRYAWFGRTDVCRVPSPELRRRFLE